MSKFLIPSVIVAVSLMLFFLSVENPKAVIERSPAISANAAKRPPSQPSSLEGLQKSQKDKSYPKLQARNIFSSDGAYAVSPEQKSLGQAAFTLLGIIGGKSKRAIFRDSTGAILSVGEGEPLMNGAVITHIERLSATAERGEDKREFVLFDLKENSPQSSGSLPPPAPPPPQSIPTNRRSKPSRPSAQRVPPLPRPLPAQKGR
jgi:hypothetical protein